MINFQWEKCSICGRDKKYVKFTKDGKEKLVCKYSCEVANESTKSK